MPTQINYQGDGGTYKTPGNEATVDHAQVNFQGSGTTKKGGTSKSRQMNFEGSQGVPGAKTSKSHFGVKSGTGQRGGY